MDYAAYVSSGKVKPVETILRCHLLSPPNMNTLTSPWGFRVIFCLYGENATVYGIRVVPISLGEGSHAHFISKNANSMYISDCYSKIRLHYVVRITDNEMKSKPIGITFAAKSKPYISKSQLTVWKII